jgi:hypothetical protein
MCRTLGNLALAAAVVVTAQSSAVYAQLVSDPSHAVPASTPLLTTSPVLLASLERISNRSPLWRQAIDAIRSTGRRALLVTPADRLVRDRQAEPFCDLVASGGLAEVLPVARGESQVPLVIVIVNLPLVREIHDAKLSVQRDFEADVDRILIHEVYGHAIPYLLAGDLSGRCADPKRGERPSDACSIRRENAVRKEVGLGQRSDDGLFSLALAHGRPGQPPGARSLGLLHP